VRSAAAAAIIALVVNATRREIRPASRSVPRPARRAELARLGFVVLGLGAAMFLAGCYRAAVELTEGRIHPLVPVAVDAPLAAELLLLVAVIVLAAAALLLAASRRRQRP
jgi:hypothetical protein